MYPPFHPLYGADSPRRKGAVHGVRFDGDSRRYRPPTANFHMSLQHRHRPTAQRNQRVKYSSGCEIWELEYPLFPQPCSTKSNHRLLNHIPDYHSKRLRVLVVCSGTPMLESTFLKLRDTASQLRYPELSVVQSKLEVLSQTLEYGPVRGSLHPTMRPATIMRHVGAGVFGPPRTLYIVRCGDSGDSPTGFCHLDDSPTQLGPY